MRKCDMWGCSVHTPVGCSRLPSAVNDLATTSIRKIIMSSTSFHSTATMKYWKKKTTNATFGVDKKGIGSGRSSPDSRWRRCHTCDCFSFVWSESHRCIFAPFVQWDIPVFRYLSNSSEDGRLEWSSCANFVHSDALLLGPASFELRITIYWISLEAIVNSNKFLFETSLRALWAMTCCFCASVLPCRAHRGVSPSWWRFAGWTEHPVANN